MSSTPGREKPRRSLRAFIRDPFGRSSSHGPTSSSSSRPVSRTSVSPGPVNQVLSSSCTTSSLAVPLSTDSRPTAPDLVSSPETISAVNAQPIPSQADEAATTTTRDNPPPTDERPGVSQSVSAVVVVSAEHVPPVSTPSNSPPDPQPNLGLTSGPTAAKPDNIIGTITNAFWVRLKASLRALRDSPGVFPRLSVVAGILLECLEGIEAAMRGQRDYEDLAKDLVTLSESLKEFFKPPTPIPLTKCISSVTIEIEQQAKEIRKKMSQSAAERFLSAQSDDEDVVRRYRRIETLFRQLQINLTASTWSIANEHLVNTRLEGLGPMKQATYDSTLASTISRRSCTNGTRTEVLSTLDQWVNDQEKPSVYWMNGMAGTGKSTIACTLAGLLENRKLLAASFFCTRTTADCRNPARIIPTIAYQLGRYSAPFQASLYEVLGDDPDMGAKSIQKQFERLIRDPLKSVRESMPKNLVVVIDALDECEDRNGVEKILDMLFRYANEVPLKFFLTSRPEPEIYEQMSTNAQSRTAFHLHDIEKSLVQSDIELYLKEELEFMSSTPIQIQELARRSGSLFIYAATLVRYIRYGKRFADPRQRLQAVLDLTPGSTKRHAEIDALYTAILASALEEARMEQNEAEDVKLVLRTVLFAQEPINMETIAALAGLGDPDRVSFAIQPLRSVLHQAEPTGLVSTLHASFPDFMSNHERAGDYFCDIVEHSQQLAQRCFLVMKEQLRFNICDLESSFVPDQGVEDLSARIKTNITPPLAYVCRYWGSHLALAPRSDALLKALKEFVCDRLLFWTEVLSVRRQLFMGIEALLETKQWLGRTEPSLSDLVILIEDARNFVTGFASSPASQSTPHIYISSLPFCPRSSSVYKNYWKRTRGLLELKGSLMERRESAALVTWNIGSALSSVAYSPDGTRVAVGFEKSGVRVLNAHDGTVLFDCQDGYCYSVHSIAFSPDGKFIASGHHDGTIRVWDAYRGTILCYQSVRAHIFEVKSIAFSSDGMRVVSGGINTFVWAFNQHDKPSLRILLRNIGGGSPTAFSPDGAQIVSVSDHRVIQLWNSHDGTPAGSPLKGDQSHQGHPNSLAFTPDGSRLVNGSSDGTIHVWNLSDGSTIGKSFNGGTSGGSSLAVSPDGTRVASCFKGRTVRVWNLDDGTLVAGPFIGHTGDINSIAYSPDGTRIIACSSDGSIRIWNVRDGILPPPSPFRDHMLESSSIMLSDSSTRVISRSAGQGVWILDITSDNVVPKPLEGPFESFAFSHPSSTSGRFAVFAKDHTFHVININDLSQIAGPFKGHTASVDSVGFSSDDTHIVTGSKDCTVRVWDLKKERLVVSPFRGHSAGVTSVAISSGHSRVVSCSTGDKTIRVWDTHDTITLTPSFSNTLHTSQQDHGLSHILEDWEIRKDGWVVNGSSELLFWIPHDLAENHAWPSPHTEFIICKQGVLHVPKQEVLIGDRWATCYLAG